MTVPTSPVAPATPTEPVAPVVPAPTAPVPPVAQTPPWGTPEEFDPEKAWALIQNLKAQKNDPAAAKELLDLRAKVQAAEDATLSAVEKERVRAERAEQALAESTASSLRSAIALEKGLTASQAKRLVGTTREELEADAAQLLVDFPVAVIPAAPSANGQGPVGGPVGPTEPIAALDLRIAEADKARDFQTSIALKQQRAALIAAGKKP